VSDDAMACAPVHVSDPPVWQRLGLGVLAEHVPAGLIDDVLAETGRVQQRVRLLPARVTVLFILALSLFSGVGYRGVWRELTHSDGGRGGPAPSTSALSQARRRIGVPPLRALFARVRGPRASPGMAGAFIAGLRLVSWDGTQLDVAASAANDAVFVPSRNRRRGPAAFGKIRLMTLIEVGTHAVIDAVFGTESEQKLAEMLRPALRPGMLLLADRNFPSWKLWTHCTDTGAHLLWRVKASRLLPRIATLPDGSWLAVLPKPGTNAALGAWVRVIEYTVTVTATDRRTGAPTTRTELFRLVTTVCDPDLATAGELAACYHARWESENSYRELKTFQRGPRTVLRSTDPDGVYQELYAYLITYQAIRTLIATAAEATGVDPDRLSFTTTLRAIRRAITTAATATTTVLTTVTHAVLTEIGQDQHQRRNRSSPRAVKRSQASYPAKRHASQQTSTTVDYLITHIPDPHDQRKRLS
jgi:Insertion element 4 transposase N-terminal/Transposase DDE domain